MSSVQQKVDLVVGMTDQTALGAQSVRSRIRDLLSAEKGGGVKAVGDGFQQMEKFGKVVAAAELGVKALSIGIDLVGAATSKAANQAVVWEDAFARIADKIRTIPVAGKAFGIGQDLRDLFTGEQDEIDRLTAQSAAGNKDIDEKKKATDLYRRAVEEMNKRVADSYRDVRKIELEGMGTSEARIKLLEMERDANLQVIDAKMKAALAGLPEGQRAGASVPFTQAKLAEFDKEHAQRVQLDKREREEKNKSVAAAFAANAEVDQEAARDWAEALSSQAAKELRRAIEDQRLEQEGIADFFGDKAPRPDVLVPSLNSGRFTRGLAQITRERGTLGNVDAKAEQQIKAIDRVHDAVVQLSNKLTSSGVPIVLGANLRRN